jgi:excisionase family DNA binding protein
MSGGSGTSSSVEETPPLPSNAPDEFLSLGEAAQRHKISSRTLRRWIARGLPFYQACPRGRVLLRPCDLDRFLTRRQAPKPALDVLVDEVVRDLRGGKHEN